MFRSLRLLACLLCIPLLCAVDAASAQMLLVKQSTGYTLTLPDIIATSDHISGLTGQTGTAYLSRINGSSGAVTKAASTNNISETDSVNAPGQYTLTLTSTETGTLGFVKGYYKSASSDPIGFIIKIVAFDPDNGTNLGLAGIPNVAAGASGGLPLGDASGNVGLKNGSISAATYTAAFAAIANRGYLVTTGTTTPASADYWYSAGIYTANNTPYYQSATTSLFAWNNGSGWTISGTLGTNGASYWTTASTATVLGPYTAQGSAVGVPVVTSHGNAILAGYQPDQLAAIASITPIDYGVLTVGGTATTSVSLALTSPAYDLSNPPTYITFVSGTGAQLAAPVLITAWAAATGGHGPTVTLSSAVTVDTSSTYVIRPTVSINGTDIYNIAQKVWATSGYNGGSGMGTFAAGTPGKIVSVLSAAADPWSIVMSTETTANSFGLFLNNFLTHALGSDNKILLSANAQTGVTIPTVTTVTNQVTANTTQLSGQNVSAATAVTFPTTIPSLAQMQAGLPTDASVQTDLDTVLGAAIGTRTTGSIYQLIKAGLTGNTPQSGDSYPIVNSGTFGNAQLVRSTTPANTLSVDASHNVGMNNPPATVTLSASDEAVLANYFLSAGTAVAGSTTTITLPGTSVPVGNFANRYVRVVLGPDQGDLELIGSAATSGGNTVCTLANSATFTVTPTSSSVYEVLQPVSVVGPDIAETGVSAAADVWAAATRTLTSGTNIALTKGTGLLGLNDISDASAATDAQTGLTAQGLTSTRAAYLDKIQYLPAAAAGTNGGLSILDVNLNVGANLNRWLNVAPLALSSQLVQSTGGSGGATAAAIATYLLTDPFTSSDYSTPSTLGAWAKANVAQSGDAYARLGAPAGASIAADIAALLTAVNAGGSSVLATKIDAGMTVKQALELSASILSGAFSPPVRSGSAPWTLTVSYYLVGSNISGGAGSAATATTIATMVTTYTDATYTHATGRLVNFTNLP